MHGFAVFPFEVLCFVAAVAGVISLGIEVSVAKAAKRLAALEAQAPVPVQAVPERPSAEIIYFRKRQTPLRSAARIAINGG